jgi:broad specificity phosphatase PhoE
MYINYSFYGIFLYIYIYIYMSKITENDIQNFFTKATDEQKEKFNKLYERLSNYEVEKNNFSNLRRKIEKLKGGDSSNIRILWVRHCESCSNKLTAAELSSYKNTRIPVWVSKKIASKMRQPLCTELGITQCLNFAAGLNDDRPDEHVAFYSSLLPRAILTSKLISSGIEGDPKIIQPLPFITEKTHFYNRTGKNHFYNKTGKNPFYNKIIRKFDKFQFTGNNKQSQSATSPQILWNYIQTLNESFIGSDIRQIKYGTVTGGKNIYSFTNNNDGGISVTINDTEMVYARDDDWKNFKEQILPILSKNKLNIIVTHGGILRKNILPHCLSTLTIPQLHDQINEEIKNKDTPNLQSYLIEYDNESYNAVRYEKKLYHTYSSVLRKLHNRNVQKLTSCGYTYRDNIIQNNIIQNVHTLFNSKNADDNNQSNT